MTRLALVRLVPRAVLLLVGCLSLAIAAAVATRADSAGAKANQPASSQWGAAVALAAPSAGEVSYGVVRVRIARGARLMLPAGLAGQRTIFASRIGGLTLRARSAQWRALRATTRVYVVVAAVPGAGPSVRDVALFVVRRRAPGSHPRYPLTVTVRTNNPQHTGTVTSTPAGINCDVGQMCTAPFGTGSTVTLTAVPNGGGFDLWQGCDQMSGYTCTVTVNQAKNVVATFG